MSPDPGQQWPAAADLISPRSLQDEVIAYTFAIYYLPQPRTDPVAMLGNLLTNKFQGFHQADSLSGEETAPTVAVWTSENPHNDCPPPDLESIQLFNHGVSPQQAVALQTTQTAMVLNFSYPAEQPWDRLRLALRLTGELAATTAGLIWDDETQEVFTPAAWNALRVDQWVNHIPDLGDHILLHAYDTDGQMRVVTVGMAKFGLPDVVVNHIPPSAARNVGCLVNAFCQAIAERPTIERLGEFDLDHQRMRSDGVGTAPLTVQVGTHEEGDSENRLLEITFDRGPGRDVHARRHAILAAAFDEEAKPRLIQAAHTAAMEAASQQVRAKLPSLRALFNEGLPPGEYVHVKAPFDCPDDSREWMWVEVMTWDGDEITGLLANQPVSIPTLQAGQTVVVAQSAVVDYLHQLTDGTTNRGRARS